jgi:predicted dehydrogenase
VSAATSEFASAAGERPRIGCLGLGWIGRARMQSLLVDGAVRIVGVADPDAEARRRVAGELADTAVVDGLGPLLELAPDGVLIATPSALHAEQAISALRHGVAVFCEKPLGRDAAETEAIITAARTADRRLAVDLSYRHTRAAQALREQLNRGELGQIYAAELVFHNAYGPDKPWFRQRELSGGGCLIDLGTHLVDLLLWLTGAQAAEVRAARVRHEGQALATGGTTVEDFATAQLDTDNGISVRLACSWFLHAGRDCVFECTLYGTQGAVSMRNVGGSFYDFTAEKFTGTRCEALVAPPDDWGGGAVTAWARALAADRHFDPEPVAQLATVSSILDRIYEAAR